MKTFLVILFIVYSMQSHSENYYVINAEGKIYCSGKVLKTGDKLTEESVITFTSQSDKLYLLAPEKGNFLLTPEGNTGSETPGWIIALKNAALPTNIFYKTATRGSENPDSFNDIYDLMGFFRDRILIIDETSFNVDADKIPFDDSDYFEFKNKSDGKNWDLIEFKPGIGFFALSSKSNEAAADLEMVYVQGDKKTIIGEFTVKFKSREEVRKELEVFFANQKSSDASLIYFEQVVPYLNDFYGNTNMGIIRDIIRSDLKIPLAISE